MSAFDVNRLRNQELGMRPQIGDGDALARSLYYNMKPIAHWDPFQLSGSQVYGGVFNLEFSPGGSLLVAACEKKTVLIFDPLTHQRIHTVNDAHTDCVNCVKFLDGRMFATCSDDTTIALWDIRNLKKKIRTLAGHSNWVKNIEYSVKDHLLVTSGLDGSIYTWDINSYTETGFVYQRVFHASGLMRCRISPDASQMVMCTTGGLLIIVHNLNLTTMAHDLQGFKPNLYRLMQESQQVIPIAARYSKLFEPSRKVNRVEFITDFPTGNDAEVVSSLQIHPQGWSALSRNISHLERSEWTCIHDIQADADSYEKSTTDSFREEASPSPPAPPPPPPPSPAVFRISLFRSNTNASSDRGTQAGSSGAGGSGGGGGPAGGDAPSATSPSTSDRGVQGFQNDVWEANITIKQHRTLQELARRGQVGRNFNMQRIVGINTGIPPPAEPARRLRRSARITLAPGAAAADRTRPSTGGSTVRIRYVDRDRDRDRDRDPSPPPDAAMLHAMRPNKKRLLYFTQETNEGKGFIKELCYSPDGRLVCSPFGFGVRLLGLTAQCSELSQVVREGAPPRTLVDVGYSLGHHPDLVVSSRFSPRHCLLVSGCLAGKIVWYQPVMGLNI